MEMLPRLLANSSTKEQFLRRQKGEHELEVGMVLAKSYNTSSAGQLSPRKALSPNTIPRPQLTSLFQKIRSPGS